MAGIFSTAGILRKLPVVLVCIFMFVHTPQANAQVISNTGGAEISVTGGTFVTTDAVNNAAGTITNDGTFILFGNYLNAGTTGGNGLFNLRGDLTNTGTFQPGNSTLQFLGTANQTITSSGGITFYNLILNNSGSASDNRLLLQNNVNVSNQLTLTSGNVETGTNKLFLTDQTPASLVYNSITQSRVIGNFERGISNTASYLFPLGNTDYYNPLFFSPNAAPTAGSVLSSFITGDPGSSGLPLVDDGLIPGDSVQIDSVYTDGYWRLVPNNGFSSTDFDISMNGTGFLWPVEDITRVLKRPVGSDWQLDGEHSDADTTTAHRLNLTGNLWGIGTDFAFGWCNPRIRIQPADTAVCDGAPAAFGVVVTGRVTLTYQWQVHTGSGGWNDLTDGGIYSGTDSDSLKIAVADLTMDGYRYRVKVTDAYGHFKISNGAATLTVNPNPVATATPDSDTICNNGTTHIELASDVPGTAFTLEVLYQGSITGASTILEGDTIKQTLTNPTDIADSVIYRVVPHGPAPTTCEGTADTVVVYVEPTPSLTLDPVQDTICDGETTSIQILSNTEPTLPVRFDYTISVDNADSLNITSSGSGTGLYKNYIIAETFDNQSDRKQHASIKVSPYTVDNKGNKHCSGADVTVGIWVEPTPRLTFKPAQDTICDEGTTSINILSPTQPTLPVLFNYTVSVDNSDSLVVTSSGAGTGLHTGDIIAEAFDNQSDRKQRAVIKATPYTVDDKGNIRCSGSDETIDIWVEPTPRLVSDVIHDTICNESNTGFVITSPTSSTNGILFEYYGTPDSSAITGISGGDSISLSTPFILDDLLINPTDTIICVKYTLVPYTLDANGNRKCEGDTLFVWAHVDPTPTMETSILPVHDTICNMETTAFTLISPSTTSYGIIFDYISIPDSAGLVEGNTNGSGLSPGAVIKDTIINHSNSAQRIRYQVIPYRLDAQGNPSCAGRDTTAVLWVEPTPKVTGKPFGDTICNNNLTDIELTSVSYTRRKLRFKYKAVPEHPADVRITYNGDTADLQKGDFILDSLENNSDTAQLVRFIIEPYVVHPVKYRCFGIPDTVEIWVEPTPKIDAEPELDTICSGEATDISLSSPTGPTRPVRFSYTSENNSGDITGLKTDVSGLTVNDTIQDVLENHGDMAQEVLFIVTAYTRNASGEGMHCGGKTDTVRVWVEPVARVIVAQDTASICNDEQVSITVNSPTVPTRPVKFRYYTEANSDVTITPGSGTLLDAGATLTDMLHNEGDTARLVKLIITPYTLEAGSDNEKCSGIADTVYVWAEPTLKVTHQEDTICSSGAVDLPLQTISRPSGQLYFRYTAEPENPSEVVIKAVGSDHDLKPGNTITDTITNLTDTAQFVEYIVTPYLKDEFGNERCPGIPDTMKVWIEPVPNVNASPAGDTLCNNEITNITLTSTTRSLHGVAFQIIRSNNNLEVHPINPDTLYPGEAIRDSLVNNTNAKQRISYTILPYNLDTEGNFRCLDVDSIINFDVWVNPTPKISVSVPDTIACHGSEVIFTANSPTLDVTGEMVYELTTDYLTGSVQGVRAEGIYSEPNFSFTDSLVNLTDSMQQISYTFTPRILNPKSGLTYCSNGRDTTITIYLNPEPRLDAEAVNDTVCYNEGIEINVTRLNGNLLGDWQYHVYPIPSDAAAIQNLSTQLNHQEGPFTQNPVNISDTVQWIDYVFEPVIKDPSGIQSYCMNGIRDTVRIYLNPQPMIEVKPASDTVRCFDEGISFDVTNLNKGVLGQWVYDVTYTVSDPLAIDNETGATDISDAIYVQNIVNISDTVQWIDYTFTAKIKDPRTGRSYCDNGWDTTFRIILNPQPKIVVTPSPDTIVCQQEGVTFDVQPGNRGVRGNWRYDVTYTVSDAAAIEGESGATNRTPGSFVQNLVNNSDTVQWVEYIFTPKIEYPENTGNYCENGIPDTMRIYLNPRPNLLVATQPSDTLCYDEDLDFRVDSLLRGTLGQWVYDVEVADVSDLGVTGYSTATDTTVHIFAQPNLINNTTALQSITYRFTARIKDPRTGLAYCGPDKDTTITIYLNPRPRIITDVQPDTVICYDEDISFEVQTGNDSWIGNWVYDVQVNVSDAGAVSGYTNPIDTTGTTFAQTGIINTSDTVQWIDYTFVPRINNPRAGNSGCGDGVDTTIRIWLNPRPKVDVTLSPYDTVCFDQGISFDIDSITRGTTGQWVYSVEVQVSDAGAVSGYTEPVNTSSVVFDQPALTNTSNTVQWIQYVFVPRIKDPRTGKLFCADGINDTVRITINPQPKIKIEEMDTIYCNNSSFDFRLSTPSYTTGKMVYDLTINVSGDSVSRVLTNITDSLLYHTIHTISETLVNEMDNTFRTVSYHFVPKIKDPHDGTSYCSNGADTTIVIYILPTLKTVATSDTFYGGWNISCYGLYDGKINLQTHGGYISFPWYNQDDASYSWNTGSIDRNLDTLNAGTYWVEVTDANGCTAADTITLTEPDRLNVSLTSPQQVSCQTASDGTLRANITGGTSYYEVTWNGPNNYYAFEDSVIHTNNIDSLVPGSYNVRVKDMNNCQISSPKISIIPPLMSIDLKPFDFGGYELACAYPSPNDILLISTSVNASSDSMLIIIENPDGTTDTKKRPLRSDYTYRFRPSQEGRYTVRLLNTVSNCETSQDTVLHAPPPVEVHSQLSSFGTEHYNISCSGRTDGIIAIDSLSGGHQNYKISWETVSGTGINNDNYKQEGLSAGSYVVKVRDSLYQQNYGETYYCEYTDTINLIAPPELTLDTTEISDYNGYNVSCYSEFDGELKVRVTGGYGSFFFNWTSENGAGLVQDSPNQYMLTAGLYNLNVNYGENSTCEKSWDIELTQPDSLHIAPELSWYHSTNVSCNGSHDGKIIPNPSGGVRDYKYTWSTSDGMGIVPGAPEQNNLAAGGYSLVIQDANSCYKKWNFKLIEPEPLSAVINSTNITCDANDNGTAQVILNGGTAPYAYVWSNGATSSFISNLAAGYYSVVANDANDCGISAGVTIHNPDVLKVHPSVDRPVSCYGMQDAAISVLVNGGSEPYRYRWEESGEETDSLAGIGAGTYIIDISDEANCHARDTIRLQQPQKLLSAAVVNNVSCAGAMDGTIDLSISGGTPNYHVLWPDSLMQGVMSQTGLAGGNYNIAVVDEHNCILDTVVQVAEPGPIRVNYEKNAPWCPDSQDGEISADITGGTPPYNYFWDDLDQRFGNFSLNVLDLQEGYYRFNVTDANQCKNTDTIFLEATSRNCLVIPTGFTPNGDGYNDRWEITVNSGIDEMEMYELYPNAVVEIFNRWGQLIYKSDPGYTRQWDGTYNGRPVPIDSYHYVINLHNGASEIVGNVTIIR